MMTEPPPDTSDLEEHARREQRAVDMWDDGERDLEKITKDVGLTVPEVRKALIARGVTTFEGDDVRLRLSEIQREDHDGTFLFDVEVLGVEGPMMIPVKMEATCFRCGTTFAFLVDSREYALASKDRRKAMTSPLECSEEAGGCRRSASATKFILREVLVVDYFILAVADIADETRFTESFDDVRIDAHLIGTKPPLGGRAKLRGKIVADPATRAVTLVVEEFKELEGRPAAPKLDAEMTAKLARVGTLPMDVLRLQIAPDMVGRPLVQEARLLALLSPTRIVDIMGKEIRGSIIEVLLGDTTTDKSESARDTARVQGFGPFVQAENAARTGLTYNLTERASGAWFLTWGILVRSNGKYVVIDGLEKWTSEMMMQLRAVMRDQEVEVDRVLHGRRPAAVRITITLNPEKPVGDYPFRCAAILGTRAFAKGPDIARVDFWNVLARDDVPKSEIVSRQDVRRPVDDETWRSLVYWSWSRRPGDVEYVPSAGHLIRKEAIRIMEEYGSANLPIVHDGFRDVLCRVSCAYAALAFSTTDGSNLVVHDVHVARAVDFLRRMYDAMELRQFKAHVEEEAMLTGGDFLRVSDRIAADGRAIINLLANNLNEPLTAKEIAEKSGGRDVGWTENAVVDRYADLKDEGLIETRTGLGAVLTARGIAFFRQLGAVDDLFRRKTVGSQEVPTENGRNKSKWDGERPP